MDAGARDAAAAVDSSKPRDAAPEASNATGVFEGDPECQDFDPRLKGTLGAKSYEYSPATGVSTVFQGESFYTIDGVDDNSKRITYLQLEWSESLRSGEPIPLTGGYVLPPPQASEDGYCIVDGRIGLAASQMQSGAVVQFEITRVQPRVAGNCAGAEQDAALRGCTYRIDAADVE